MTREQRWRLPYVIKRQKDSKYLVLDRDYRPLYFPFDKDIDEHHMALTVSAVQHEKLKKLLKYVGDDFYFYDDASIPYEGNKKHTEIYEETLRLVRNVGIEL